MLFQNQVFKKMKNQEMSKVFFFYLSTYFTFWDFYVKQIILWHEKKYKKIYFGEND